MTLEETIEIVQKKILKCEETAQKYFFDDRICFNAAQEKREQSELLGWLKELETYRKFFSLDNDIKATLSEINDIHERIRQCNERYEQRMKELERPVKFYDINGPLKITITREEDNNG